MRKLLCPSCCAQPGLSLGATQTSELPGHYTQLRNDRQDNSLSIDAIQASLRRDHLSAFAQRGVGSINRMNSPSLSLVCTTSSFVRALSANDNTIPSETRISRVMRLSLTLQM